MKPTGEDRGLPGWQNSLLRALGCDEDELLDIDERPRRGQWLRAG